MIIISTRILHSYDTQANWNSVDPVIKQGELIIKEKANGSIQLAVGNIDGGVNASQAPVIWDEDFNVTPKQVYKNLTDLGFTSATVTLQGIANKLQDGDTVKFVNSNNDMGNIYPTGYGTFTAERIGNTVIFMYYGRAGVPSFDNMRIEVYTCNCFINQTYPIEYWQRLQGYSGNYKTDNFNTSVDYVVEQKLVTGGVSYEKYASGKVVIYGRFNFPAGVTYYDFEPPVALTAVLFAHIEDYTYGVGTASPSTTRSMQYNSMGNSSGLTSDGKVRFVIYPAFNAADGIIVYIIGRAA